MPMNPSVRSWHRRLRAWPAAALLLLAAALPALAAWETGSDGLRPVPALSARVTDPTGTLSAADRQAIEDKLAAWERDTGNQLAVLIVPTTAPEPIEAYSLRVADAWKIGRKGQDNGVLFLVAKDDRKMRLEVGYGLEGVLPDVTARRIIAEDVAPLFRQEQYGAGITRGVERVIEVVGKGGAMPEPARAQPQRRKGGGFGLETWLVLALFGVPILGRVLRSIFGKVIGSTLGAGIVGAIVWFVVGSLIVAAVAGLIAWVVMLFMGLGGGLARAGRSGGVFLPGGGGFGGGGFGGGGGGGFSGGGGSFGGGGASGNW